MAPETGQWTCWRRSKVSLSSVKFATFLPQHSLVSLLDTEGVLRLVRLFKLDVILETPLPPDHNHLHSVVQHPSTGRMGFLSRDHELLASYLFVDQLAHIEQPQASGSEPVDFYGSNDCGSKEKPSNVSRHIPVPIAQGYPPQESSLRGKIMNKLRKPRASTMSNNSRASTSSTSSASQSWNNTKNKPRDSTASSNGDKPLESLFDGPFDGRPPLERMREQLERAQQVADATSELRNAAEEYAENIARLLEQRGRKKTKWLGV